MAVRTCHVTDLETRVQALLWARADGKPWISEAPLSQMIGISRENEVVLFSHPLPSAALRPGGKFEALEKHDPWAWEHQAPHIFDLLLMLPAFQRLNPFPLGSPKGCRGILIFQSLLPCFTASNIQIQVGTVENITIIFPSPALPFQSQPSH